MQGKHSLLWIDLCSDDQYNLLNLSQRLFKIHKTGRYEDIDKTIESHNPDCLCFDFDFPDFHGLKTLHRARCLYPALPVIMLTRYHSEAIALWSMRMRIWDLHIKPVNTSNLVASITMAIAGAGSMALAPPSPLHCHSSLPGDRTDKFPGKNKTQAALAHITKYYASKISLNSMAQLCHMSPRKFSQKFKQEYGLPFKEFLLRYRIDMAMKILDNSVDSIITVALSVGFNDHSYFSRMFRRYVGMNPSVYRHDLTHLKCDIPCCDVDNTSFKSAS